MERESRSRVEVDGKKSAKGAEAKRRRAKSSGAEQRTRRALQVSESDVLLSAPAPACVRVPAIQESSSKEEDEEEEEECKASCVREREGERA